VPRLSEQPPSSVWILSGFVGFWLHRRQAIRFGQVGNKRSQAWRLIGVSMFDVLAVRAYVFVWSTHYLAHCSMRLQWSVPIYFSRLQLARMNLPEGKGSPSHALGLCVAQCIKDLSRSSLQWQWPNDPRPIANELEIAGRRNALNCWPLVDDFCGLLSRS